MDKAPDLPLRFQVQDIAPATLLASTFDPERRA